MVLATANISFPDYNNPMFGDSWPVRKRGTHKTISNLVKSIPNNQITKIFCH